MTPTAALEKIREEAGCEIVVFAPGRKMPLDFEHKRLLASRLVLAEALAEVNHQWLCSTSCPGCKAERALIRAAGGEQ